MAMDRAPIEEQLELANMMLQDAHQQVITLQQENEKLRDENKRLIAALKLIRGYCGSVLTKHAMSNLDRIRGVVWGVRELADF